MVRRSGQYRSRAAQRRRVRHRRELAARKEFALIAAAPCRPVSPCPQPLWLEPTGGVTGRPFYVMRRVNGHWPRSRRLLRSLEPAKPATRWQSGSAPSLPSCAHPSRPRHRNRSPFCRSLGSDLIAVRAAHYRKSLDALPEPQPVLEWAINRMGRSRAEDRHASRSAHRDFRTGNYMAENGPLTAILDFEFSGWSDPYEDLGWFCARCWRFGAVDREAGGIGTPRGFLRRLCARERPAGR